MQKTKITILAPRVCVTDFEKALPEFELSYKPEADTDIVLVWSVSQMGRAKSLVGRFPLINYCWDLYEWAYKGVRKNDYDYIEYGDLLRASEEIWAPSRCTAARIKEFYGIRGAHTILTSVPYFEHDTNDGRYILQPIRDIPDKWNGWVEKACLELQIPCVSPDHQMIEKDWRKVVAECSFIASALYEGSTGGLSVMEGYYLGKPALGSDTPYSGLKEYMGDRIEYFGTYDELLHKLQDMWDNPRSVAEDHKEYIKSRFSHEVMGAEMTRRIKSCVARLNS